MKIALTLSGLPRIDPISAASWGRIIGKYSPDVFIHTWSSNDADIRHKLNWIFKPTKIFTDDLPEIDISRYSDRHWPNIDVYRSLSMWRSINAVYNAAIEHDEYDIIIRGRFDWHVHELKITQVNGLVIPLDKDKLILKFNYMNRHMYGYNDHFAYGHPKYMNYYMKTLDEIPELYSNEGIDYCPENFLAATLAKYNVPVILQKMEHTLIRG